LRHFLRSRGDFVDTLVTELARAAGCVTIYSFDREASKRAGMTLLR
jgi:predicted nucleic-acid-binding protein